MSGCSPYILSLLYSIHFNVVILTALGEQLRQLFEKYMTKITEFKKANCNELVPIAELNGVVSLTRLFDALATQSNGVSQSLKSLIILSSSIII